LAYHPDQCIANYSSLRVSESCGILYALS
jgi:hypothetical protein